MILMETGKRENADETSDRTYLAIDLKSFYASVECRERGLDPLSTNLVVADAKRTDKTICLAVTPTLKARGVPSRPRLFEVVEKVREINAERKRLNGGRMFSGGTSDDARLCADASLKLEYITAKPRMALYISYSARIYDIYLSFFSKDDIVVYSIDEVFIDVTSYLGTYGMSAEALARAILAQVAEETGITATAGIGTNLYLAKVAMDIEAKRMEPDANGARIALMDERRYRERLWSHVPITDFWRVGRGCAEKLRRHGIYTMGDVARRSIRDEDLFYGLFGANAELLIDHAWGHEPCLIRDIKAYRPAKSSLGSGQVLPRPYAHSEALLVATEMADDLSLNLVAKRLTTDKIVLSIRYDAENLKDPGARARYSGKVERDAYGRAVPRHARGTFRIDGRTSSSRVLIEATKSLFSRIADKSLTIRKLSVTMCDVVDESTPAGADGGTVQTDFFAAIDKQDARLEEERKALERERKVQEKLLEIKAKYGKNAILKGMNLKEGATSAARNAQIGGHAA